MMLTTKFELLPYPYYCHVFIGHDEETFNEMYNQFGLTKEGTDYFEGKTTFFKDELILWLRNPSILTLAHEAVHVTTFLLDRIGVPISFEGDEVIAYTVQYIIREVLRKFGQHFNLSLESKPNLFIEAELERVRNDPRYAEQVLAGSPTIVKDESVLGQYDASAKSHIIGEEIDDPVKNEFAFLSERERNKLEYSALIIFANRWFKTYRVFPKPGNVNITAIIFIMHYVREGSKTDMIDLMFDTNVNTRKEVIFSLHNETGAIRNWIESYQNGTLK